MTESVRVIVHRTVGSSVDYCKWWIAFLFLVLRVKYLRKIVIISWCSVSDYYKHVGNTAEQQETSAEAVGKWLLLDFYVFSPG